MARPHNQIIVLILAVVFVAACGSAPTPTSPPTTVPPMPTVTVSAPTNPPPTVAPTTVPPTPTALSATATNPPPTTVPPTETEYEENEEMSEIRMRITVGDQTLIATLIDNATTRSLIEMLPFTLPMMDLYSRELVYRLPEELPANEAQTSGYEVGDISYWTPSHAFVIFYTQNGEIISNLQKIGHIDSGVEILDGIGSVDVTFELLDE